VMVSSSGTRLLSADAVTVLRERLIPRAVVVTPNIPEAEALTGIEIDGMRAMRRAASLLRSLGSRTVLIKGGHWPNAAESGGGASMALDLFFDGRRYVEFSAARIAGEGAHGTGCALSAAIAGWLARGVDLETAIGRAKRFMTHALKNTFLLGTGR